MKEETPPSTARIPEEVSEQAFNEYYKKIIKGLPETHIFRNGHTASFFSSHLSDAWEKAIEYASQFTTTPTSGQEGLSADGLSRLIAIRNTLDKLKEKGISSAAHWIGVIHQDINSIVLKELEGGQEVSREGEVTPEDIAEWLNKRGFKNSNSLDFDLLVAILKDFAASTHTNKGQERERNYYCDKCEWKSFGGKVYDTCPCCGGDTIEEGYERKGEEQDSGNENRINEMELQVKRLGEIIEEHNNIIPFQMREVLHKHIGEILAKSNKS